MYCMVTGGYSTLYLRTASRQEKKNKVAILPKLGKHHFIFYFLIFFNFFKFYLFFYFLNFKMFNSYMHSQT